MSYSYDLAFWEIEKRDRRKPYRLRWSVNGRRPPFSRSFLVKELAEAFRDEVLKAAARRGERFDEATGLPESMLHKNLDVTWYQHAHEYVAARWKGSAGNSRPNGRRLAWGAVGVRELAEDGIRCQVMAKRRAALRAGLPWSGPLSAGDRSGAPSRIRTCAHGSGGRRSIP
jgi:hypothetical protein